MTQTAIPNEFENYLQSKITAGEAPDLNQMIFAYIPNLDIDIEIDRAAGLPEQGYWVHQQDVDQVGKLDVNAVVYSTVIPSTVAAFTFNAIYLHDKYVENSCGMVIHKEDETKQTNMTTTRSLVQQYNGAAQLTGITVDAETWQIDYQARLLGIEETHRLTCLDDYGSAAFIDGFEVIQRSGSTQYIITPGVAYIGGLRVTLDAESVHTLTGPISIYLDVSRRGGVLSQWNNELVISLSATPLDDYIDNTGLSHYIAKVATINADGSISNVQRQTVGAFERTNNRATDTDIDGESAADKHVALSQYWRGIDAKLSTFRPGKQYTTLYTSDTGDHDGLITFGDSIYNYEFIVMIGSGLSNTLGEVKMIPGHFLVGGIGAGVNRHFKLVQWDGDNERYWRMNRSSEGKAIEEIQTTNDDGDNTKLWAIYGINKYRNYND